MPAPAKPGSLAGVKVVVTRPETESGPLSSLVAHRGADVLHWPTVRFEPPENPAPLEAALERLETFDGIVFTSPRAVEAVCQRVAPPRGRPWVAAVGDVTREALAEAGWAVDRVPAEAGAAELARQLGDLVRAADSVQPVVLFPASSIARTTLPRALEEMGARVEQLTAYRTVLNDNLDPTRCLLSLEADEAAVMTFASPSAVTGLAAILGEQAFRELLTRCPTAVIGPSTANALEKAGIEPAAVAETSTMADLADAVEHAVQRREEL